VEMGIWEKGVPPWRWVFSKKKRCRREVLWCLQAVAGVKIGRVAAACNKHEWLKWLFRNRSCRREVWSKKKKIFLVGGRSARQLYAETSVRSEGSRTTDSGRFREESEVKWCPGALWLVDVTWCRGGPWLAGGHVTAGRVVIGGMKCRSASECEGEGLRWERDGVHHPVRERSIRMTWRKWRFVCAIPQCDKVRVRWR
jgi:hypothetical protein